MAILTALLGSWGRKGGIFLPTPVPRGGFELPSYPESARGRADGAGTQIPARARGARRHQRPRRRDHQRRAVSHQGVDRLRPERPREHSTAAEDARGDRQARLHGRRRRHADGTDQVRRSGPARSDLSGALRPADDRRDGEDAVRRRPFPGVRAAVRIEAGLVDRETARAPPRARRVLPLGHSRGAPRRRDRADEDRRRRAPPSRRHRVPRTAVPRRSDRRHRIAVPDREREDRALLRGPQGRWAPTRCRATRPSSIRPAASSGSSTGARRCTPSRAARTTTCSTR